MTNYRRRGAVRNLGFSFYLYNVFCLCANGLTVGTLLRTLMCTSARAHGTSLHIYKHAGASCARCLTPLIIPVVSCWPFVRLDCTSRFRRALPRAMQSIAVAFVSGCVCVFVRPAHLPAPMAHDPFKPPRIFLGAPGPRPPFTCVRNVVGNRNF